MRERMESRESESEIESESKSERVKGAGRRELVENECENEPEKQP